MFFALFATLVSAVLRSAEDVSLSHAQLLLPLNQQDRVQFALEGHNGCFRWCVLSFSCRFAHTHKHMHRHARARASERHCVCFYCMFSRVVVAGRPLACARRAAARAPFLPRRRIKRRVRRARSLVLRRAAVAVASERKLNSARVRCRVCVRARNRLCVARGARV